MAMESGEKRLNFWETVWRISGFSWPKKGLVASSSARVKGTVGSDLLRKEIANFSRSKSC